MRKVLPLTITVVALFLCVFALPADADAQRPNKRARSLVTQGDRLFRQRRYQESLQRFTQAVGISPVFPRAHYFKGRSHYMLGQAVEAIREFDVAQAQGFPAVQVTAARMEAHLLNKNYASALADVNTAIRLAPDRAYFHAFLGRLMILDGNFEGAVGALTKSLELNNKSADTYYLMAVAYGAAGDTAKQGQFASEALKRATSYSGNAWYLLADTQRKAKNYTAAAQSFTNSINAYKNDIATNRGTDQTENDLYRSFVDLADVYRNLNRFDDAIDTAKEGLSLRPDDGNLHISLAWYYSLSGKTASAVAAGQKAVQLSPTEYMAHTNLCRAYNDQGEYFYGVEDMPRANTNFNQAIASCERALAIQPNDGETNYYIGRAYFFLDKPQQSDSFYRKSVPGLEKFTRENPDYSDGFYLLGNAYFATKQNKKAITAYSECLRISPRFARVRYNLGYVFFMEGELDKAKNQQTLLEALDKELADRLGQVLTGK